MNKFLVAVSMLALSTGVASAASISDLSGAVKVNRGEGFVAAVLGQELQIGDKVLVGKDSFAALNLGECSVSLDKPMVVSITKTMSCDSMAAVVPTADVPDDPAVFPIWPIVAIGVVGGGFIAYEVLCDDDGVSDNGGC